MMYGSSKVAGPSSEVEYAQMTSEAMYCCQFSEAVVPAHDTPRDEARRRPESHLVGPLEQLREDWCELIP